MNNLYLTSFIVLWFCLAIQEISDAHPLQQQEQQGPGDSNVLTTTMAKKQGTMEATNFYVPVLYDTIINGGQVINTESQTIERANVGIADGKVVIITTDNIPPEQARNAIDVTGQYVSPGLIDLHTHVYHGSTYWGLVPDPVAAITGVTTWVDAGSSGAYNFLGLKENVIDKSALRIFAFLHMSGIGLTGRSFESTVENNLDTEMANATILQYKSIIKGIKVRMDRDATGGTGLLALERAREVADSNGIPIMVHIGIAPPNITDIIPLLQSNDILTHAMTGQTNRLVDDEGRPLPVVQEFLDKNIVLDVGHGTGSFSYFSAEGLIGAGIWPDVISSDIHQLSRFGPMFDLPTTISKFINLGMPLAEAIAKATIVPARILKEDELGVIKVGFPADIAIFRLEDGDFTFADTAGEERQGRYKLTNTLTMVNGVILERKREAPPPAWVRRDLDLIAGRNAQTSHNEL